MTRTLWSINGLATEFGLDRRTVAKRLRDVPPDRTTASGHKGWFLAHNPARLRWRRGAVA